MAIVLKRFLIIIISCLASFFSVQQSFAKQQSVSPDGIEMQAVFEELDKVLRIFDLGEIEDHLRGLDRSDPASMAEVYLILAYHHERISQSGKPLSYFKIGISLADSDPNFEQREFYETYEAILYYLIFGNISSREKHLDAWVRISNMEGRNKIQKHIKCAVSISGLIQGYASQNVDIVALSSEECSEKDGLRYLSYLGAALHGQALETSWDERRRFYESVRLLAYDESKDAYARLESGLAFFSGTMGIEAFELSLEGALIFKKLLNDFELENTHLHFASLLGMAGINNRWGNKVGHQQFKDQAQNILKLSKDPIDFLNEFSTEILSLAFGYGVGKEYAFEILDKRWKDFQISYDGNLAGLTQWKTLIRPLALDLYFEQDEENKAIEVLNSFIKMHDQGPAMTKPLKISNDYAENTIKLIKGLNKYRNRVDEAVDADFEFLPFIYQVHFLLAELETFRDNDKLARPHFELAWKRLPESLKIKNPKSVEILNKLLNIYSKAKDYEELPKTALLILDIVEKILFLSEGPFAIQQYESSGDMRHEVEMSMYELWSAHYRAIKDENPVEAQGLLAEAFRALQIMRANRLTKFYKTSRRETALSDISDFKKYTNLSEALIDNSELGFLSKSESSPKLNRDYKFSNLKSIQSKIPSDTIIIVGYDTKFDTQFAEISSNWFNPFASSIDIEELSKRMGLVIKSAQSSNGSVQFNYENANWIYKNIFKTESDYSLLGENIKNIIFLPSKTMFNFPLSLLHNGQKTQSENTEDNVQYDPNGFLLDDYYISYAVDFSAEMFGGSDELNSLTDHKAVEATTFFALSDPYFGNDKVSVMRGITYVDIDAPDFESLNFESLPETLDEVNAAAEYFKKNNVTLLSGAKATKKNVLSSRLIDYDVLMFSTHGVSPGVVPGFEGSGLLLSLPNTPYEGLSFEDVLLTPEDVLGLNLNADIVILNACNSGLSDVANAPGLTGLAQSFLAAGSDAVMVSHWPISSATTVQITKLMFKIIKNDPKKSFNQALTEAQLVIKSDPNKQHPFYWAPYNIYGNF